MEVRVAFLALSVAFAICRDRRDHHDDQIGRDQANPNPRYFVGTDFKNLASSV
jgi:hypothetical protein